MIEKLTDRRVATVTAKAGERLELSDTLVDGLQLRVGATTKTWIYRYRLDGTRRRLVLGTAPALTLKGARDAAMDAARQVQAGVDPVQEEAQAAAQTFADLAADYIQRHAMKKKKTWQDDQRKINACLLPAWGKRAASSITRKDVRDLVDTIAERAPVQANRVRALVSKIFAFAVSRDWVPVNPVAGLGAPTAEKSRKRFLSKAEVGTFWYALTRLEADGSLDASQAGVLRLRLLLGQRGGEVAGMRWEDVVDGVWTQPDPKNGRAHALPVTAAMQRVLDRQRALVPAWCPFVFPDTRGSGPDTWRAARAVELRVPGPGGRKKNVKTTGLEAFGIAKAKGHDLRRTCATHLARLGVQPHVIGRLQNHAAALGGEVMAIYNQHAYMPELTAALDAWEVEVEALAQAQAKTKAVA